MCECTCKDCTLFYRLVSQASIHSRPQEHATPEGSFTPGAVSSEMAVSLTLQEQVGLVAACLRSPLIYSGVCRCYQVNKAHTAVQQQNRQQFPEQVCSYKVMLSKAYLAYVHVL